MTGTWSVFCIPLALGKISVVGVAKVANSEQKRLQTTALNGWKHF